MVEPFTATGIMLETVLDMKEELIGFESAAKATIQACKTNMLAHHRHCMNSAASGSDDEEYGTLVVALWKLRQHDTWVPHGICAHMLVELRVHHCYWRSLLVLVRYPFHIFTHLCASVCRSLLLLLVG